MKTKFLRCFTLFAFVIIPNSLLAQFYKVSEAVPDAAGTAINNRGEITGELLHGLNWPYPGGAFVSGGNKRKAPEIVLGGYGSNLGWGINDSGEAVGTLSSQPILWVNGMVVELGGFGGDWGQAYGINNKGKIVGVSGLPGNITGRAFYYINGVMSEIGSLGGSFSAANAINDHDQIVGTSQLQGNTAYSAFIYENGRLARIVTPGIGSDAHAINNRGQVVGQIVYGDPVTFGATGTRAFMYSDGKLTVLETLGGDFCSATGINDKGQIVGSSYVSQNTGVAAFIYINGKMFNLNDCIPKDSGWDLSQAYGINNKGQITGYGMKAGRANWSAFILTPTSKREE